MLEKQSFSHLKQHISSFPNSGGASLQSCRCVFPMEETQMQLCSDDFPVEETQMFLCSDDFPAGETPLTSALTFPSSWESDVSSVQGLFNKKF
ncbi:MAG: hypothetical protein ACK5IJ_05300 [Mangrovibacterium sp.]